MSKMGGRTEVCKLSQVKSTGNNMGARTEAGIKKGFEALPGEEIKFIHRVHKQCYNHTSISES